MALEQAVGSFNIGTGAAGTTVTITPGFETKALILWWNGSTSSTDAAGSGTNMRGMGFATSSSSFRSWTQLDTDNVGTSDVQRAWRNDACIVEITTTASTFAGWADVQSISSTQVVFEILDAFVTDMRIFYLALGGSDITAAECGDFVAAGTAPVNQTVNTSTQGKLLFLGGCREVAANTWTSTSGASAFFGVATDSSHEYVWSAKSRQGSSTGDATAYCYNGECIAFNTDTSSSTVMFDRAEFVSFNATPSFTINWIERTLASNICYLQLSGTFQVALGDILTLNTTGTITETGLAFQPTALLLTSANRAQSTQDVSSADDKLSLGAATGSGNQLVMNSGARNANTTMFTQIGVEYDAIYDNIDTATDGIVGKADFTGFTSDGFTLNMSDADPVASFAWYVAFASAANTFRAQPPYIVGQSRTRASFH